MLGRRPRCQIRTIGRLECFAAIRLVAISWPAANQKRGHATGPRSGCGWRSFEDLWISTESEDCCRRRLWHQLHRHADVRNRCVHVNVCRWRCLRVLVWWQVLSAAKKWLEGLSYQHQMFGAASRASNSLKCISPSENAYIWDNACCILYSTCIGIIIII